MSAAAHETPTSSGFWGHACCEECEWRGVPRVYRSGAERDAEKHNREHHAEPKVAVAEPICFVVVELREPEPWIEDGPFTREEAVQVAAEHTEQMSTLDGSRYAAAAVYLLEPEPAVQGENR